MSVFGLLILPEEKTTKNEEMYWYEYYLVNIEGGTYKKTTGKERGIWCPLQKKYD